MKLIVLIRRQTKNENRPGSLRAYVLTPFLDRDGNQCFKRGTNLLPTSEFSVIDSAIQEADKRIMDEYKLTDPPEIEWRIEDEPPAPVAPCRHEHLDMDGICHRCGTDCRGAH